VLKSSPAKSILSRKQQQEQWKGKAVMESETGMDRLISFNTVESRIINTAESSR
jgi:hypothetical protein